MPDKTTAARAQLEQRVRARFLDMGMPPKGAAFAATGAVAAYYDEDDTAEHHALVSAEVMQIMLDIMPSFATSMRMAFESMQSTLRAVAEAGAQVAPYAEMARLAKLDRPRLAPIYNASGLPTDDAPESVEVDIADEVWLADTGRHAPPTTRLDDDTVIEVTTREWHFGVARRLRKLGCTYQELKDMHDQRAFVDSHHHSAWFAFGDMIDREQLDRAYFVLSGLEDETGEPAMVTLNDHTIAELERDYPTDRITGAPHHFVVNGDHSACGCGGHLLECETWNIPENRHAPSICGIARTLCRNQPRHTYRELCPDDSHTAPGGGGARP